MLHSLLLLLALAFPSQSSYQPLLKSSEYLVVIARDGDTPPWVSSEHQISVGAEAVFQVLSNIKQYRSTFGESIKLADILSEENGATRLHIVWPLPWPMKNRDAVVTYNVSKSETGYAVEWEQSHRKGDPEDGLRIERVRGRTDIIPVDGTSAKIVYTYFADLGGDLPDFIKEGSYKEEPRLYFNAIRKALKLPEIPKS